MTIRIIGSTYYLTYDAENRLTFVSGGASASFIYDGDGNRVKGVVNSVTTTYISNYYEWTGSTSTMKSYYYSGSVRVAMRTGTTLNWLLGDHLGSTSITTDAGGVRTAELRYKPWGEVRYTYGTTPTTYKFTGQRLEQALGGVDGLYYYGARWMDPYLNRWIQPDEIIPDPGNPQSFDRYAYSFNNPVRFSDPSGHDPWDVVGQFFTGMGAEFTRTSNWMGALASPSVAASLSPTSGETDAMLFGRVAGDVVTVILGTAEVGAGATIAGGGVAVGCGFTFCLTSAPAVVSGVAVATYGVGTTVSGAAGLGENLGRAFSSNKGGSDSSDDWFAKKPTGGIVQNKDGTSTEYTVRQTPGKDGGWSRTVVVRDANGNVISVTHEAWNGSQDPRMDPPYHTDEKPVNKK